MLKDTPEGTTHYQTKEGEPTACEEKEEIKIVLTQDEWEEKLTELMYGYKFPNRIVAIKDFIRSLLTEATKAENDRWMNQPANEHDARIRADEKEKVAQEILEEIQKMILYQMSFNEKSSDRFSKGAVRSCQNIFSRCTKIAEKYYSSPK